jgi:hypothetical protein
MGRKKNRNSQPMQAALAAVAEATPAPANDTTPTVEDGQTVTDNGQTETAAGPTEEAKVNKGGRPKREEPEPPKWTIRGVDRETRTVIEKASDRAGKTLGEYFCTEVREFAANQVKRNSTPPMSPQDIRNQLKADVEAMETRIASTTADQLAQLRRDLLEARTAPEQRKSFLSRLFG